ncbi:MAG: hypothetical protein ACP5H5_05215 [Pyrobaculum sp.]
MEKIIQWIEVFNQIAKNESNYHSFYIEKGEDFVDASLTLEEVSHVEECRGGAYAAASVTMRGGKAYLEMTSGSYRKCPTQTGYTAEYTHATRQRIELGDDPEVLGFVKSIKNEGDLVALLEAVLQAAAKP